MGPALRGDRGLRDELAPRTLLKHKQHDAKCEFHDIHSDYEEEETQAESRAPWAAEGAWAPAGFPEQAEREEPRGAIAEQGRARAPTGRAKAKAEQARIDRELMRQRSRSWGKWRAFKENDMQRGKGAEVLCDRTTA